MNATLAWSIHAGPSCLTGRVAVVTGGGTGIGRAVSLRLAALGCSVAVVYAHSQTEADDTVAAILAQGGQAQAWQADIAHDAQVRQLMADVVAHWGGLDYLVNNAGITRQRPFAELEAIDDGDWDELFATNVRGTFQCCRAAAPYLRQQPDSSIVNVGSIAGETGYGSSLPYAVSKAAVHGLTRSLARALAPHIRVNAIAPGAVATRWWAGLEDKMHTLAGHVALQRVSTAEDIAATLCALLLSPSVTGQVLRADNGQTL